MWRRHHAQHVSKDALIHKGFPNLICAVLCGLCSLFFCPHKSFSLRHIWYISLSLGSFPKTKPPPLLSLHRPPGLSLGAPPVRVPLSSSHSPYGAPLSRGLPLLPHASLYHPGPRGPHGIRGTPPSLKSSRPPLLSTPGASFFPQLKSFFVFLCVCLCDFRLFLNNLTFNLNLMYNCPPLPLFSL